MEMTKKTLDALSRSIGSYFTKQNLSPATLHTPHLADQGSLPAKELTGLITLSGVPGGLFYLTATKSMLRKILLGLGIDPDESQQMDLVGEMSNIFAGNLSEELGVDFVISTPFLIAGAIDRLAYNVNDRPYVLPFSFQGEVALVIIAFEGKRS